MPGPSPKSGIQGISFNNNPRHATKPWRVYYKRKDHGYFATCELAIEKLTKIKSDEAKIDKAVTEYKQIAEAEKAKAVKPKTATPNLVLRRKDKLKTLKDVSAYAGVSYMPQKKQWKAVFRSKTVGYSKTEQGAAALYAEERAKWLSVPVSGHKGVYFHPTIQKWYSMRNVNGKRVFLGYHEKKEAAIKAYHDAHNALHWKVKRQEYDMQEIMRQELLRTIKQNEANIIKEIEDGDSTYIE